MDNLKRDFLDVAYELVDIVNRSRVLFIIAAILAMPVLTLIFGPFDEWFHMRQVMIASGDFSVQELPVDNPVTLTIAFIVINFVLVSSVCDLSSWIAKRSPDVMVWLLVPCLYLARDGQLFWLGLFVGLVLTARPAEWVADRIRESTFSFRFKG